MTDQEKQVLSERIATLGDAAGINEELLWEAAKTCPQGHHTRDPEWGDFSKDIGDVCHTCWNRWAQIGDYGAAHDALLEYASDQSWHPEWRIGRQAKDMTNPAVLLPVVEAWRQKSKNRQWEVHSACPAVGWLRPEAAIFLDYQDDADTDALKMVLGAGDTPGEALAQAFTEALAAEKGESA